MRTYQTFYMLAAFILLLIAFAHARVIRVGIESPSLTAAVDAAAPGDTVELSSVEYVLPVHPSGVALTISRSITIKAAASAVTPPIIRAANADGLDALIGIGASNVRLENLIIGRPAAGTRAKIDNLVAIAVSAGTENYQSAFNSVFSYDNKGQRDAAVGSIRAARDLKKRDTKEADKQINTVISKLTLTGIDFTASQSHTNIGFGRGAYVDVRVTQCRFSESETSNSIVVAASASFDNSCIVERNTFAGSPVLLLSDSLQIGSNFWAPKLRKEQTTYCIDQACTRFGPVIDGNTPTHAFATIIDAARAGVSRIVLTVHDVEWARSDDSECYFIKQADTSISGLDITTCSQTADDDVGLGVTNINVRPRKSGSSCGIAAFDGALSSVSNVQFTIHEGVGRAISIHPNNDDVVGTPSSMLLIDRVAIYGHSHQSALTVNAPTTRVVLNEVEFFGASTAIVHVAGSLSITDSILVSDKIGIEFTGTSNRGIHITDTLFFNKGPALKMGAAKATSFTEFFVSCSRFLFASIEFPRDCSQNGQFCASGVRHNTFIVAPNTFTDGDRALLTRGANHYEEDDVANVEQYFKFVYNNRRQTQVSFALHDHEGRIDDASGVVTIGGTKTHWSWLGYAYVPMRQECYAATVPSVNGVKGRVVSNMFDLHTDAPTACVSVALRVALANKDVDLQASETLAIYSVEHVGSTAAEWALAASHIAETSEHGATIAVDASSGNGALMRAVVVAAHIAVVNQPLANKVLPSSTPAHVALAVTKATKQFCVSCGGDRIPGAIIDERCGGGSGTPVFHDLDAALAAVADAKRGSVSLLVYGDKCATRSCSIELAVVQPNKLIVEGISPTERGYIRRPAACSPSTSFVRVGTGVTLRYLLIAAYTNVASAVPTCTIDAPARQVEGPRLAYLTVSGGVCIGRGRVNTVLLNNEISVSTGRAVLIDEQATGTTLDSNVFLGGNVRVLSTVSLLNNLFDSSAMLDIADGAQITATGNTFAARRADTTTAHPCVVASTKAKSQLKSTAFGDHCELRLSGDGHQLIGGNKWLGVRAFIVGASQLIGITLGSGTVVQGSSGTILDNVAIDLDQVTVGDTLRGSAMRKTPCAQFEPLLNGFALRKSSVYNTNGDLLFRALEWPSNMDAFVSFKDGSVQQCAASTNAEFCFCAANKKPQKKPDRERVLPDSAAEPKKQSLADKAAAASRKGVLAAPPGVPVVAQTVTNAPTPSAASHTTLWIVLGVGGAIFVLICFGLIGCLVVSQNNASGEQNTTQTNARPQSTSAISSSAPQFKFSVKQQ